MIWPLQGTALAPRLWAWKVAGTAHSTGRVKTPNLRDFNVSSAPVQSLPDFRLAHPTSSTPTVAVSATSDSSLGGAHRVRLNSAYVTSLENAGLVPLVVPPLRNDDAARAIVSRVDGILL